MDLSLQLAQKQMLSQKMQQSVAILQMNSITLSEYISELSQENPLLEWKEEIPQPIQKDDKLLQKLQWLQEADEQNRGYYKVEQDPHKDKEDNRFTKKDEETLQEYLMFQGNMLSLDKKTKQVIIFLAQSVEDSGYLDKEITQVAQNLYSLTEEEIEVIMDQLHAFDPPGVGARTLKECLDIQLAQRGASPLALEMVENYLPELAKNRMNHIAKLLKVPVEDIVDAFNEIKSCNPKPGRGFTTSSPVEYVIPDVVVERQENELTLHLNSTVVPKLFINTSYIKILQEDPCKKTEDYVANKLKQAQWAMQCISKRESTLLRTSDCIVTWQKDFFLYPDGQLRPLKMAEIADQMEVHESTVSRAVKDKYLQCERGVFPLSAFFSKALNAQPNNATYSEGISADSIHQKLKILIEEEEKKKPLSDRELTQKLQEHGIEISRRTVAKYREQLGICGASGRKEY